MSGQRSSAGRRTGRRPGSPDTREQILAAARVLFAAAGFEGATVRAIADAAGVNVALISHYFGGKRGLFEAARQLPADVRDRVDEALGAGGAGAAESLTRAYLGLWEDPVTRPQLLAVVRSSTSGDHGPELIRAMLADALEEERADDGVRARAVGLAMGHLLGVAVLRHVTAVPALAEIPFEDLVAEVAPAVQVHLDRVSPGAVGGGTAGGIGSRGGVPVRGAVVEETGGGS